MLMKPQMYFFMIFRDFLQTKYHKSLSSLLSKLTKSDSMFTLACEYVLNFLGKKMSANQNAHTTFFTCEKISYRQVKYEFYFSRILHANLYTHIINLYLPYMAAYKLATKSIHKTPKQNTTQRRKRGSTQWQQ